MRRVLAIMLAGLAAACASPGGERPQASRADANAIAAKQSLGDARLSPAAWPTREWWTRLGDPQLDQLVHDALAGSPSMRLAEARVRKAMAAAGVANAARAPQVNGGADATYQRYPEHGLYPRPLGGSWNTSADLDASLRFDLDLWGRNRATSAAALDEAHAAEVDRQAARLLLSTSIVRAYIQLARGYDELDIARAQLAQREALAKLVAERTASGLDSKVELRQAQAAVPEARERIAQLEESIATTGHQIAALMGAGPDRGATLAHPALHGTGASALPTNVPAELIGRRPDIVAERWRIEAASHGVEAAKAAFYPDVNLVAFIGLQSIGLSKLLEAGSTATGIGPALTLPIFDGGRLRANLAGRDADYDIAVERYNQGLADALREVADQLAALRSIDRQRSEVDAGVRLAQDGYDLALLRYREGMGNYLQVLTAETQVLGQKNLRVSLAARSLDASVSLARALGGGYRPD